MIARLLGRLGFGTVNRAFDDYHTIILDHEEDRWTADGFTASGFDPIHGEGKSVEEALAYLIMNAERTD